MAAGVQGQSLEVTVISCTGLKDTEWFGKQDPYVAIEYGTTKHRTKTCSDGDKNPTFNEKFVFPLVQGLSEMNVLVWNKNKMSADSFIGSGKIKLSKCMTQGFDDTNWPIWTKEEKIAGEVKMILRYENNMVQAPPPGAAAPGGYGYSAPAPGGYGAPPPPAGYGDYPPAPGGYPAAPGGYPPAPAGYPPAPGGAYPPGANYYPPPSY